MRGLKKVKRIHELKKSRKKIMDNIKKWDAMYPNYKAMPWNGKKVMRLYHQLENIDTMLKYARKGIDYKCQRIYLSDLINDINIY